MIAYKHRHHVGGAVPSRFAFHVVMDSATVNLQSVEQYALHLALLVVTIDYREVRVTAVISYVAEGDVLHTFTRGGAVFLVVAHLHLQDASLVDILYSYIVEHHILDVVIVAAVYRQTTLIVNLRLTLTKDVDILVSQSYDTVAYRRVAMYADEDRMGNVCPQGGVPHPYVSCRTVESLSGGVGSGAVV